MQKRLRHLPIGVEMRKNGKEMNTMPTKEIGMKKQHPKMPLQQISRSRIPTPSGMSVMRLKLGRHFRQQLGRLSSRDRPRAEARKEKEKARAA
jgi:hypothetical protein